MINNTVSNSRGFGGKSGTGKIGALFSPTAPGLFPKTPKTSALKITGGGAGFGAGTGASDAFAPAANPPIKGVISPKKPLNAGNTNNSNPNKIPGTSSLLNAANPIYQKNPMWIRPGETQADYNARISKLSGTGTGNGGGSDNTQNNAGTPPPPSNTTPPANQTFPGLVKTVSKMSAQPTAAFTSAQQTANQALQQLQESRINEANALAANAQNAIPLEFQQGRAQVLQNQYLAQQNAYAQQYTGAISAEQAATGQQQAQLGGAEAAAGLTTPQLGQYGQAYYQPLNAGAAGGSAGVSPTDPFYKVLQGYAQDLVNNQVAAVQASGITSNPVLWNQVLQMAQRINPNFNYNAAVAGGAVQQANIQTGGTASTTANQQVYNAALSKLATYQNMANNIKSFGGQLINNMQTAGINPTSAQYANMTLNQLQTQFSNAGYATFNTNIQGLQARVSDLLNTGEIPSSATAGAQAIVNGNISLGAMEATLNQINNEANAIVQNQSSIAKNAFSNIQANTGTGTNQTNQNGSNSIYNF